MICNDEAAFLTSLSISKALKLCQSGVGQMRLDINRLSVAIKMGKDIVFVS